MPQNLFPWLANELTLSAAICKRGDKTPDVRKIQEWLYLDGFGLVVDGDFGPATEQAVKAFQTKKKLPVSGLVDVATFTALSSPLRSAETGNGGNGQLGNRIVALARQHLQYHPREVGGQNRGPWVRMYMEGREGKDWPWCAGFVCFILRQALREQPTSLPIKPSFSCDELAQRAGSSGRFISGFHLADPVATIKPGYFFLVRKSSTDWTHVGIVTKCQAETIETIEGNTNDDGDREGYEVCSRIRGLGAMDFIRID